MEFVGTKNNKKFYIEYDEPDYSGELNPLNNDNDNLWTLVSFDYDLPLDKNVKSLDDFQEYLEEEYNIFLNSDTELQDLLDNCQLNQVPEDDFFSKLEAILKRNGVIALPINKFEHDNINLSIGVKGGFDNGIVGIAFVTKKDIRKEFDKKRISKKTLNKAIKELKHELVVYSDYSNGDMLNLVIKDNHNDVIDQLGGIFESDYDNAKNKLAFVSNL